MNKMAPQMSQNENQNASCSKSCLDFCYYVWSCQCCSDNWQQNQVGRPITTQPSRSHELNYLFYTNQIPSQPNGDTIENILQYWFGDRNKLEGHHGYIQWLFPTTDRSGNNKNASPLTQNEIEKLSSDREAMRRLLKSFKLMLDFYGMVMKNDERIERAAPQHWDGSHKNLIRNTHNNARISRILRCLSIFKYDKYCLMWMTFLVNEVYNTKALIKCKDSLERYWLQSCNVDVQNEIRRLIQMANREEMIVDLS